MGYQIGDRKLPLDIAFDHNEIQYPANWLRLSTAKQRDELGITWVADTPQNYDQRFYWGVDNPMDLDGLKTLWKSKQSQIATSLLNDSDKRVIKALDEATTFAEFKAAKPANYTTYRAAVRTTCNTRQTEIDACSDVAALKELMTGSEQIQQGEDEEGNPVMVANPNVATAWPDPID